MLYTARCVLRLCRRQVYQNERFNHAKATITSGNDDKTTRKDFKTLYEQHKDKITFNSFLEQEKLDLGHYEYYKKTVKHAAWDRKKEFQAKSLPPIPVALQYMVDKEQLLKLDEQEQTKEEPESPFQLPLANATDIKHVNSADNKTNEFDRSDIDKWMVNYEYFDDSRLQTDSDDEGAELDYGWSKMYGTPDLNERVSMVPCGGCGALFHCNDPAIPGYLPSEIFKNRKPSELRDTECQRCHFLKEYNIALDVSVDPEEYEKLLQSIRPVKSLVLLMVDLLDFPCSIWPGIVDIIGTKRPIIVVGNKVDLLPGDSRGYLKRIQESLQTEVMKTKLSTANIKHFALISAKTGYGIENLISAMFKIWLSRGDVFLIGCTNVGKSSLFNALLQSDYCKVQAVDIIKRATVSRWPGTTLNLLKFPINRPSGWKLYERNQRLKADSKLMKAEMELRRHQVENRRFKDLPTLIGHIGRSFSDPHELVDVFGNQTNRPMTTEEKNDLFSQSKWFYDTPGVIHPDQVLSMLTTEELLLTIPKHLIRPQTYYLKPGTSLFIGGLARIDFLECMEPCRFTVYCSDGLPITVTKTDDADQVYSEFIGTELFGAPVGGAERLKNWPGLKKREEVLEFVGEGPKTCCGDVVLSSVGWVSVTAKHESVCKVVAWTPEARGIHQRQPSLLPFGINLKGKRLRDTPAYMVGKVYVDEKEDYDIVNKK